MTHEQLKAKALQQQAVADAYDQLEDEFSLLRQMLAARHRAGLTQDDIAQKMGTKATAVTRLESSLSSGKHSPSLSTLRKYAKAVGCRLEVRLIQDQ
ncbi:MAG: helix-turn-helix transcriptional regulator [Acaryochloris sp. RU_4_1]|nr:helix-turn-helix transcriptional regulator [Acaryochloris sp. RU_4_1]NJR54696.1 helix-turn-helix transcriptional regulator [Acaryochloris sp. CRU_2_0]